MLIFLFRYRSTPQIPYSATTKKPSVIHKWGLRKFPTQEPKFYPLCSLGDSIPNIMVEGRSSLPIDYPSSQMTPIFKMIKSMSRKTPPDIDFIDKSSWYSLSWFYIHKIRIFVLNFSMFLKHLMSFSQVFYLVFVDEKKQWTSAEKHVVHMKTRIDFRVAYAQRNKTYVLFHQLILLQQENEYSMFCASKLFIFGST